MRLTPTKSPVKLHKWSFEEDKAFIEFMSIAKTDPKYGKSYVKEWPAFSEKNSFWDDGGKHIKALVYTVLPPTFSCQVMYGWVWTMWQRPIIYAQFHWTFALQFDRNVQT